MFPVKALNHVGIAVRSIDDSPRQGAHHMQIAFVHPKSTHGVLTELCQPAK